MSTKRSIPSRLFEGLGRVTWRVIRRKIKERQAAKSRQR